MNKYRTHNCSELSEKEIDKKVYLDPSLEERAEETGGRHGHAQVEELKARGHGIFFLNFL